MKLISLSITNMRKIRAAELDFDGKSLVEVRGRNGAGKSTVIDSILYLLKGSSAIPGGVVTNGEEKGVIVGQLGEYTVRRVITPEGKSTLTVEGANGKVPKPQEFLDQLAGKFLDPEWFVGLKSSEKRAIVLAYSGLDFTEIDQSIAEAEQNRLLLGRELKALGALPPEPEYVEAVDVRALIDERAKIIEFNEAQRVKREEIRHAVKTTRDRMVSALTSKDFGTFDELREMFTRVRDEFDKGLDAAKAKYPEPEEDKPTIDVDSRIQNFAATNAKAQTYKEWIAKRDSINNKKAEYDAADAEVTRLREEKHGMVAGARMPMKGLTLTDGGLAFQGVSDENWSDSEALKIALNVAIAFSGDLKAVYIKRGERLDSSSIEKLRAYAEAKDFQIIMEVVDDSYAKDGDSVLYIEEGEIRSK